MECSLNARLLFIGTWNFADDYGNLNRSKKQLKARIFPGDDLNCEQLIVELLCHGLLTEYSVNGEKYLHIQNFAKHQVINRPGKPQCPEYNESLKTQTQITEDSLSSHGSFTAEGKEGKEGIDTRARLNESFVDFWVKYPKKRAKGAAERAWIKIHPDEQLAVRIFAAIDRAAQSSDWKKDGGQFIPHPATWLNAKGWEDEFKREQEKQPSPEYDPKRMHY